jgi:hypothetical protein
VGKEVTCRHCKSTNTIPYGDFIKWGRKIIRTFKCLDCGKATTVEE